MKKFIWTFVFSLLVVMGKMYASEENKATAANLGEICSSTECYTIIKKLGEGAFGEVFAVKNSKEELFAIKAYKPQNGDLQSVYSDIEREFNRGQMLHHPHIIKSYEIFNAGLNSPTQYLVLQLVEGETLFDINKGSLTLDKTIIESIRLCEALKYALSQGFIHFDLHEFNIMLNTEKEIMIIDLASFLSFEEILTYYNEHSETLTTDHSEKLSSHTQDKTAKATKEWKNKCPSPKKFEHENQKAKQFFLRNPTLLKRLQKLQSTHQDKASNHQNFQWKNKAKTSFEETATHTADDSNKSLSHELQLHLSHYYFETINEMCNTIIAKSNLSRNDKFNLKAEIKKISWHYAEDIEENCELPLEDYFDRLIELLRTY